MNLERFKERFVSPAAAFIITTPDGDSRSMDGKPLTDDGAAGAPPAERKSSGLSRRCTLELSTSTKPAAATRQPTNNALRRLRFTSLPDKLSL